MKTILLGIISLLIASPVLAEELAYNILSQDQTVVKDVKSDDGSVWIKLDPKYADDTFTVRISNQNRDSYRLWFNNSQDLVSSETRGHDLWSDRVQTVSRFIEYWHNDALVLHLEKK